MLVLAPKAGLHVDGRREKFPRQATLPFDPTYQLMATFNAATDASGAQVVRCFVSGAAPAVGSRSTGVRQRRRAAVGRRPQGEGQSSSQRLGEQGLRVMAAACRDLDPAAFDPDGDLLGYVTGLQLTSLRMIDPPREESRAAVRQAQDAHIRVRMVTGDDVVTGAAVVKQVGIPGEAILAPTSPPCRTRSG